MKYSGIKWIGKIPDNWNVRKVKQCFYISKEQAHEENPTILSLARAGVKVRDISNNEGQLAASYDNYNPVMPGDLLLNPMDLYSGANCSLSEVSGVISPAYINLRKKVELNPKFYDYYFKTQYWAMAMFAHGKGVSFDNRWTMNAETLLNYYLPFPSSKVQDKIVNLINKKTAEIDSLIDIVNQQIQKLKEYKQAVVVETITKGLDKNAPMKDSGVEWIGIINKESSLVRLRFLVDVETGNQDTQNAVEDGKYPFYVRSPKIERNNEYSFDGPGILMAGDGAGAGRVFHYAEGKYAVHQRVYRFSNFRLIKPRLLKYYLETMFPKVMEYGSAQTTVPSVRLPMILDFQVVIPYSQDRVVEFLDKKIIEIDSLITLKQEKIMQLEDYKKSLIYEYVTGKKEVC